MSETRQPAAGWEGRRIVGLGHSTRSLDQLVELLGRHGVTLVADIRSAPGSRRHPQFNRETLASELPRRGIGYVHLPRLGGRRRPASDSPNAAWRNDAFRGFADYMRTPEFARGLEELRTLSRAETVALLCAEAVPWRCHRSLVADALWARGVVVEQITGPGPARPHRPTPFARFDGTEVTYPPEAVPPAGERGPARGGADGATRASPVGPRATRVPPNPAPPGRPRAPCRPASSPRRRRPAASRGHGAGPAAAPDQHGRSLGRDPPSPAPRRR